jgi:RimJ/RimL family protein N-acetyltransferase
MAEIFDSSDPFQASTLLANLRIDKRRNAVLLKYHLTLPAQTKAIQIVDHGAIATLLLLDPQASAYDRQTYPDAKTIALIVSDQPTLTDALSAFIPLDQKLIFKLTEEQDAHVLAKKFTLTRATSYFTYMADGAFQRDPAVSLERQSRDLPLELFAKQGHDADWLVDMITRQQAFACVYRKEQTTLSACIAFKLDDGLWEIGGVYTLPEQRGLGHARRTVSTAVAELHQSSNLPRYQVAEGNAASIRLAESLSMTCSQRLTHYHAVSSQNLSQTAHP